MSRSTSFRAPASPSAGGRPAEAVTARRLRPPSWRDPRLLVGLLLVLGSVVAGAAVVRAADHSTAVYVARHVLTPGSRLTTADVTVQRVRISSAHAHYLLADGLRGERVVLRTVAAGELVAASAVGAQADVEVRPVPVPVSAETVDDLGAGVLVDVWVAARSAERVETFLAPQQVASNVEVSGPVTRHGSLGSATASSVRLLLPPELVPDVIEAVDNGARITLVPVPATLTRGTS